MIPEPTTVRPGWGGMTTIVPPDAPTSQIKTGRLVRWGGAFVLEDDDGKTVELRLMRVPVDHVGKSVTVTGHMLTPEVMEVDGVRAA